MANILIMDLPEDAPHLDFNFFNKAEEKEVIENKYLHSIIYEIMRTILFRNSLRKMVKIKAFKLLFLCFMLSFSKNLVYSTPFLRTEKSYVHSDTTNKRLIIRYHTNGKVKEKGYQGYYSNQVISTGTYLGTWNTYNENGSLIQSIYYYNDIPSKAFIQKKKYYTNGKLESIEKFNNYELYESGVDSIGTWKYFNSNGKLIREISHKRNQ